MPFRSKAQRRKFAELLVKGEISPETFEEWSRETGDARLPERAPRKRTRKKRASAKRKQRAPAKRKQRAPARKRSTAVKRPPAKRKRKSRRSRK
jgi:hypothetical protein